MATGRASSPLSVVQTLLCFRASACGINVDMLDGIATKAAFEQRGLATSGSKKEMLAATMRWDAMVRVRVRVRFYV